MTGTAYAHTSVHDAAAEISKPGRLLVVECEDCGLRQTIPSRVEEGHVDCVRCGALLSKRTTRGIEQAIGLNLAALIVFVLANAFPFITLNLQGRIQDAEIVSAAYALYEDGMWELGLLVFLFAIFLPLLKILGNLYVMIPLHMGFRPPAARQVFRWMEIIHRWAMMEVFLLGVIVGYVKLISLATVIFGIAAFSFVALIMLVVAAETVFEPRTIWERLQPSPSAATLASVDQRELISCHGCGLLNHAPDAHGYCERCDARLHHRKPNGVTRAWALIITALILYFPANIYPVMKLNFAGAKQGATILEGVKELLFGGMWPLALLVFFASVTVPMLKLGGLGFLLVSVQRRSKWHPRERTKIYRIVDAIGRWSMLDIFVLAILVALVRFGSLATITPGTGAISFAAVVVITMIAAESFDPRQIWDAAGANDER